MIILGEFLKIIYGTETEDASQIWIYDGHDCEVGSGSDNGLFTIFKSCYVPEISLSDRLLKKQVVEIVRTDYGIAVCVEDAKEDNH